MSDRDVAVPKRKHTLDQSKKKWLKCNLYLTVMLLFPKKTHTLEQSKKKMAQCNLYLTVMLLFPKN